MSDLEQDLPGTIVCYADMCRFMAQEDVIKERDKRIKELEAALAQSIQSQTTAERKARTTLKVFYTSIHEVVPREYWKPLDDYMIKNAVKEDT